MHHSERGMDNQFDFLIEENINTLLKERKNKVYRYKK